MRLATVIAMSVLLGLAGAQSLIAQGTPGPKPGPEHARLGYFVGQWKLQGEVKPSPLGPGGKLAAADSCEWFEGQFSVVCRSEGTGPWGPTKAVGILGFDPEQEAYTYYEVNNSPMTIATVPKGAVQGTIWTYTDEPMMAGKRVKTRVTITEVSPSQFNFKSEMLGADGKWATTFEATATKTP